MRASVFVLLAVAMWSNAGSLHDQPEPAAPRDISYRASDHSGPPSFLGPVEVEISDGIFLVTRFISVEGSDRAVVGDYLGPAEWLDVISITVVTHGEYILALEGACRNETVYGMIPISFENDYGEMASLDARFDVHACAATSATSVEDADSSASPGEVCVADPCDPPDECPPGGCDSDCPATACDSECPPTGCIDAPCTDCVEPPAPECTTDCLGVDPDLEDASSTWSVEGRLANSAGIPLSSHSVTLYDREPGGRSLVGAAPTDADGYYSFTVSCWQDPDASDEYKRIDPLVEAVLKDTTSDLPIEIRGPDTSSSQAFVLLQSGPDQDSCGEHDWTMKSVDGASSVTDVAFRAWHWGHRATDLSHEMWPHLVYQPIPVHVGTDHPTAAYTRSCNTQTGLCSIKYIELGESNGKSTVYHEMAHYIHDMVWEGQRPATPGSHETCPTEMTQEAAWVEGFAVFWSQLPVGTSGTGCTLGPLHEFSVASILYNWCDPECAPESGFTPDPGGDPAWKTTLASYMEGQPWRLHLLDEHTGSSNRYLTVAGDLYGWNINDPPTGGAIVSPAPKAGWYGRSITVHVNSIVDQDTYVGGGRISMDMGSGSCAELYLKTVDEVRRADVYASVAVPYGHGSTDVRVCVHIKDETGAYASQTLVGQPIKVDTIKPQTDDVQIDPDILDPTRWTISWQASDAHSGVDRVGMFEKRPGQSSFDYHPIGYAMGADGSVTREFDPMNDTTGKYCYGARAVDKANNWEPGPYVDKCYTYPSGQVSNS